MSYFLYVYLPSDFTTGLPDEANSVASGSIPFTLTLSSSATRILIEVEDDETVFDEVDSTQSLASAVTLDGTTYAAGTTINTAYDLIDSSSGLQVTSFILGQSGYAAGAVQGLVSTEPLTPGTTYTFDTNRTSHLQDNAYTNYVACFTPGTCIATPEGPLPVEQLRIGDLVTTQDNGDQEIRWIGRRHLSQQDLDAYPNLRPVRIRAGALGGGLPEADLIVSPQHRILVSSKIATRLFGVPEVLVAAKQLVSLDGIDALTAPQGVTYIHFMCARHEVVFAAGAPTESMYAGRQALLAMPDAARREIFALFPELINMDPDARPPSARHLPSGRMARKLAKRHKRNNKPVLHGWPENASA